MMMDNSEDKLTEGTHSLIWDLNHGGGAGKSLVYMKLNFNLSYGKERILSCILSNLNY
jgi:hypothetical protein